MRTAAMFLTGLTILSPLTATGQARLRDTTFGVVEANVGSLGLNADRLDALMRLTRSWVDSSRIVGAEVLILKQRRVVRHEVFGWSDAEQRRPMQRGSVFRIRSMTKPFTGTAALLLVDEGRLDLEAPVGRYLPSWRNEVSGTITVKQLLSHFSGFEQGGTPHPASSYTDLRSVVDASGTQGPQHPPGERFRYSDVNSFTLGAIVAQISEMPLEQFIRDRIVQPLGLEELYVGFDRSAPWAARTNPTYGRDDNGAWAQSWKPGDTLTFSWFRGSGGMFSTSLGYARWLDSWMDASSATGLAARGAGGLLSPELSRAALTWRGGDDAGGYGYHWEVSERDPLVFGHGGSDGTIAVAVPSEQLILVYFTQSRGHGTREQWITAARRATAPDPQPRPRSPLNRQREKH